MRQTLPRETIGTSKGLESRFFQGTQVVRELAGISIARIGRNFSFLLLLLALIAGFSGRLIHAEAHAAA